MQPPCSPEQTWYKPGTAEQCSPFVRSIANTSSRKEHIMSDNSITASRDQVERYIIVSRDQSGHLLGGQMPGQGRLLDCLRLVRDVLWHNIVNGAYRAEVHSLLPSEEFTQATERIERGESHPIAVAAVLVALTLGDLSDEEIE
jgi:hypothetical protein